MRVFFLTTASSKEYKSWSNIPYLLQKNLEKRGYIVENHVLRELNPFKTIFNLPIRIIKKFFKLETQYFYVRTPLHFFMTYLYSFYIKLVSAKDDVIIVQGFSYPLNNKKNRQIIIGDWPSEYLFEKFLKRIPTRLERKSIDRENKVIECADAVITLFPNVHEYMLQKYKNRKIYCFNNVVNIDDDVVLPRDIRQRKLDSNRLLFIGQTFYLEGALELVNAALNLRKLGFECEVDIVGIERKMIHVEYEWLKVYGYLDKGNAIHKKLYYEILSNARLFVNTTNGWSGFQAILEAMYFHNPIVVKTNETLISYFPSLDSFAHMYDESKTSLEAILVESFSNDYEYQKLSDAAKKAVESSTWNNFTNELIKIIIK